MVAKLGTAHGEEGIELLTGQRLRFLARSTTSGRGFSCDCMVFDEAMILDAESVAATVPTLSARDSVPEAGPQVWYTGSAGLGAKSEQLGQVRERGVDKSVPRLLFGEWSAVPHADTCEPACQQHDDDYADATTRKANPGYGWRLTTESVARERTALGIAGYRRERLGVGVYPVNRTGWSAIPKTWWDANLDEYAPRPGNPALAVHIAQDRSAASIGVAGRHPDPDRVRVELLDHRAGTTWILPKLVDVARRWKPCAIVMDTHSATGSLLTEIEAPPPDGAGLTVARINQVEVGHAFGQLYDYVKDGRISQGGDPDVATALGGGAVKNAGTGKKWDEDRSGIDISAAIVITFALWGYLKFGP